jgi:mannose-6-phosphate isomerase-like protein (cupin superfamily)
MTFKIRRVVTTHDADGKAVVMADAPADNPTSRREGHASHLIWMTDATPSDLSDDEDMGARDVGRPPPPGGTIFRVLELQPGVAAEMHRTDTVDYVIILEGAIDMEMDDGVEVRLEAGDVLVQRGTYHSWINRGTVPCRLAAVLVDAKR